MGYAPRTRVSLTTSRENSPQFSLEVVRKFPRKTPRSSPGKACWLARPAGLADFFATATMIVAGPILVGPPPPGPVTEKLRGSGSRPDEMGQQMTHFRGGQSNERGLPTGHSTCGRGQKWTSGLHAEADQEGVGQQDQGEMAIPAHVAAHFIVIQPQVFGGLQVLFNAPAHANGLH